MAKKNSGSFKTKAEKVFDEKLSKAIDERNWDKVELLFRQFGTYLELIAEDEPEEELHLTAPSPCGLCGSDPAKGLASIQSSDGPQVYYCHEDESPTCYELAQQQIAQIVEHFDVLLKSE